MNHARNLLGGAVSLITVASLSGCAVNVEPAPADKPLEPSAAGVHPERALGPNCVTTSAEATLDFADGPYSASSPDASYTAPGCAGEFVVDLARLDVAFAENFWAGTSLYFKDGSFPSTYDDCVNARLVATVYAYEGGSWATAGKLAMHGAWIYSGGWSCAPRADSPGSDAVYFNPSFGFSSGRVVAKAYVLPYGQAFLPYALPLGVDLF
jgi:hypothetical protein